MWKYIIYKYTNIINNKIYIGQTNNEQRRKREHFSCSIKKKKHKFHKAIDKYGIDNFKYEVMCYCKNRHEADLMEIFFINKYDSFNNGYNMTIGGMGYNGTKHPSYGRKHTLEERIKISQNRKGLCLGENHKNYKNFEYYKNHPITRGNFKLMCKNKGWNFNNFKEIYSNEKVSKSGNKKYFYEYIEDEKQTTIINKDNYMYYQLHGCERNYFLKMCKKYQWNPNHFIEQHIGFKKNSNIKIYIYIYNGLNTNKSICIRGDYKYYQTHSIFRSSFKRTCKIYGWEFSDFVEIFDRWHTYPNGTRSRKYKYIKR